MYLLPCKYPNWLQLNMLVAYSPFLKEGFSLYAKQGMPFFHRLAITYLKLQDLAILWHP